MSSRTPFKKLINFFEKLGENDANVTKRKLQIDHENPNKRRKRGNNKTESFISDEHTTNLYPLLQDETVSILPELDDKRRPPPEGIYIDNV